MNEKLTFTGGEPNINFDDLDRNNKANKDALIDSFRAFGDNYIIQGVTGDPSITAGYVMLDGEILQVDAHTKTGTHFVKVTTYDSAGDKTFNDTVARQTWAKNRATVTAGSGSLAYSGAARLGDVIATLLRATASAAATTVLAGIVEKATTAETEAGTADKYIDAALLQALTATTTRKGIVEKATTAEAQGGTAEKYLDAALLQLVTATETRAGVQENATLAEAQALTATNKTITPATAADITGSLLTKVVEIGDWNMDANITVLVAHGLGDIMKIRAMTVIVRNDANSSVFELRLGNTGGTIEGYISSVGATFLTLQRITGGAFDNVNFDSTSYNRGWIKIDYSI